MVETELSDLQQKVLGAIRAAEGPLSPKAIAGEVEGYSASSVRKAVRRMKEAEVIAQAGYGLYDLPDNVTVSDVPEGDGAKSGETSVEVVKHKGGEYTLAHVPLVSVRGDCGEGEEPFETEIESYLTFEERQIRQETGVNPRRLVAFRIVGNSMRPTLHPGDKALIAQNNGEPIYGGAVYAFHREMQGIIVKRAHWKKDGALLLRSDNREDPVDFEIGPEDDHEWNVLGRVVKVIKDL